MRSRSIVALFVVVAAGCATSLPEPAAGWNCGGAYVTTGDLSADVIGKWRSTFGDSVVAYVIRSNATAEVNYETDRVHTVTSFNWRIEDDGIWLFGADQESRLELEYENSRIVRLGDPTWERCFDQAEPD
jgi:hypothetical protein